MLRTAAVVLAAGKGERMKSDLPKVLHKLGGLTLIDHVLRALAPLKPERTLVVVGHQSDLVAQAATRDGIETVVQEEQRGTGDAVRKTHKALAGFDGTVLVLVGDAPLLPTETIRSFLSFHEHGESVCTIMTTRLADPTGYGRVARGPDGSVQSIVEHKDATDAQLEIKEINTGILAFRAKELFGHIGRLSCNNAKGEYYLTDMVGILREAGYAVGAYLVEDDRLVRGVNSREQLAELERIYNTRPHTAERC